MVGFILFMALMVLLVIGLSACDDVDMDGFWSVVVAVGILFTASVVYALEWTVRGVWYLIDKDSLKAFLIKRMWRDLGEYKVIEMYDTYELHRREWHDGIVGGFIPKGHWTNKGWSFRYDGQVVDSLKEDILAMRLQRAHENRQMKLNAKRKAFQKDVNILDMDNHPVKVKKKIDTTPPPTEDIKSEAKKEEERIRKIIDSSRLPAIDDEPFVTSAGICMTEGSRLTPPPKMARGRMDIDLREYDEPQYGEYHEWIVNEANRYLDYMDGGD